MPQRDRRQTAASLEQLERLIERMDALGAAAEDAAARITKGIAAGTIGTVTAESNDLLAAIGDVIEIVTERSRLAHEAHRLIVNIRTREMDALRSFDDRDPQH